MNATVAFLEKKGKMFFDKENCFIVQLSHTVNDPSAHFLPLKKKNNVSFLCGVGNVCISDVTFAWLAKNIIHNYYFSDRFAYYTVTFCYSSLFQTFFLHFHIAMHFLSVKLDYSAWCAKRGIAEYSVWMVVFNCVYSCGRYPSYKHRIHYTYWVLWEN